MARKELSGKMKTSEESMRQTVGNSLLNLFWELAEGNDKCRSQATEKLISVLRKKQENNEDSSHELEYTVKRLVKGLASNRKWARLGFATALTQVLRSFPILDVSEVLKRVKEELVITKHEARSEQSNIMLGKVMAYLALIQSETLFHASPADISTVFKLLMMTRTKKVPIHQLCVQALCQIISKVSTEIFQEHLWCHLESELTAGWENCSPDTFQLLLTVNKHHRILVGKEFLASHWKSKTLLSEKNFDKIKDIMMKSTADHPVIHAVCPEIVKKMMKKSELFASFWKNVISDKLITQTLERRYLGFQLILIALREATGVDQVRVILTETIVQAIVMNLCDKNKPLHAAVKKLIDDLVVFLENSTDSDTQIAVVTSLIQRPGTVLFDSITKTKTIQKMVSKFTPEATQLWSDTMMNFIRGNTTTSFGDLSNQDVEDVVQFALHELACLLLASGLAGRAGWHCSLLQFLFLHGFFSITEPVVNLPLCDKPVNTPLSETSRKRVQGAFFKALDKLATFRPTGEGSTRDLKPYLGMLEEIMHFAQTLLTTDNTKVVLHKDLSPGVVAEWEKVLAALEEIKAKHSKDVQMGESHAFLLLFMHLGLQLFSEPREAMDILKDLHVCYKKAFIKRRRMSMKSDGEPEWMEVVTEMLLSLLSQESHLVRVVVTSVFRMLAPHMTKAALQLVLSAMTRSMSEEDGPLDFEDEDEDEIMEEGGQSDEETAEENQEDEEHESSEDEEDEEDSEEEEVDEKLRSALKEALGDAVVKSDDEEESLSDLNDEAMFNLDDALSAAFKNMVRNKKNSKVEKEKKQQLKAFKLKCLDLLNGFISSEPPPSLALELLMPLLELMDKGTQDKTLVEVARRATNVYHNLVAPRKVLSDPHLDQEDLPPLIQNLINFSAGAHGVPIVLEVASGCLFVIRILLGLESNSGPSPIRTRSRSALKGTVTTPDKVNTYYDQVQAIIKESLQNFCLKRDTHLNHMLFHSMFERQASILWPQVDKLLELLQNQDVRIFCRTRVCSMLTAMINKATVAGIGDESWANFSEKLVGVLPKMLLEEVKLEELKPRFVHELLLLLLRASSVSECSKRQLLTPQMLKRVTDLRMPVKKGTKAVCKRILQLPSAAQKMAARNGQNNSVSSGDSVTATNGEGTTFNGKSDPVAESVKTPNGAEDADSQPADTEKSSEKKRKKKRKSGAGLDPASADDGVSNAENAPNETPGTRLEERLQVAQEEEHLVTKSGKKKRKSVAEAEHFTLIKSPKLTDSPRAVEASSTGLSQTGGGNSPGMAPNEETDDPLTKSGKKKQKKRKSVGDGEEQSTAAKSTKLYSISQGDVTTSELAEGISELRQSSDSARRVQKGSKTPRKTLVEEDPDQVGRGLEQMFTPTAKAGRRRSVRLSLLAAGGGTPKATV